MHLKPQDNDYNQNRYKCLEVQNYEVFNQYEYRDTGNEGRTKPYQNRIGYKNNNTNSQIIKTSNQTKDNSTNRLKEVENGYLPRLLMHTRRRHLGDTK